MTPLSFVKSFAVIVKVQLSILGVCKIGGEEGSRQVIDETMTDHDGWPASGRVLEHFAVAEGNETQRAVIPPNISTEMSGGRARRR